MFSWSRIGLLALLAVPVHAVGMEFETDTRWPEYFASNGFHDVVRDMGDFLQADAQCRPVVTKVADLVARYGESTDKHVGPGAAGSATQQFMRIKDALADAGACKDIALKAYYLSSYQLLQTADPRRDHSDYVFTTSGPALLAVHLANKGKIRIEAPPVACAGQTPRREQAAYSCGDSTIHLFAPSDLTKLPRPYDAGAALSHEEDHLVRDKTSNLAAIRKVFPSSSSPSGIDWNTYSLADETLAIVLSAVQQRQAAFPMKDYYSNVRGMKLPIHDDLSMIRENGELRDLSQVKSYEANATHSILPLWPNTWFDELLPEERKLLALGVFTTVAKVYFGISSLDQHFSCQFLIDLPSPYTKDLSALPFADQYWYGRAGMNFHSEDFRLEPIPGFRGPDRVYKFIPHDSSDKRYSTNLNVAPFLDSLEKFDRTLDKKTETCAAFEKASADGELTGYLGQDLGHAMRGCDGTGTPTNPSGDGVKPGTPVQPSGDGVKPDADTKP